MFAHRPFAHAALALATLALSSIAPNSARAAGDSCIDAVVPNSLTFSGLGGPGELEVQGMSGCEWTAETATDWISLDRTSGVSGQMLPFRVQPLPEGLKSRKGGLTVNDIPFTVVQTVPGPPQTEALRLFGDVTFNSRDLLRQYSAVAAGNQFTLAVTDNPGGTNPDVGRVVGFGHSQFNQCVLPEQNEGFAQVSAGETHSMALTNGNGLGTVDEVAHPPQLRKNFRRISASDQLSFLRSPSWSRDRFALASPNFIEQSHRRCGSAFTRTLIASWPRIHATINRVTACCAV